MSRRDRTLDSTRIAGKRKGEEPVVIRPAATRKALPVVPRPEDQPGILWDPFRK